MNPQAFENKALKKHTSQATNPDPHHWDEDQNNLSLHAGRLPGPSTAKEQGGPGPEPHLPVRRPTCRGPRRDHPTNQGCYKTNLTR